jgi:leucyl aminopeptidase
MPDILKLSFAPFTRIRGVLVVFCSENLKFGPATRKALAPVEALVQRAAVADRFTGKTGSALELVAPTGLEVPRLVVIGTGKESELKTRDLV